MAVHDYAILAQEISAVPARCGGIRIIGIDGPAGSGKTTLAAGLSQALNDCPVVHMDDVYNGWLQDFEVELGQRLSREILLPLQSGYQARYEKYDWYEAAFTHTVAIPSHSFLILEGVGSCNSVVAEFLSYRLWIEADAEVLIDRIIARDGEAMRPHLAQFKIREAQYFLNQRVKERANLQLSGD